MSNKDPARLIDVINALEAVKGDTSRRLRRDGSNVDMTPEQAAAFRAAIGAGSGGGGGGSGDVVGPASSTQNALAQFADSTGKLLKGGPLIGVSSPGSLPTRADADDRYQAKAAALTALAGLNAPGLYYLSDVDAWSPVTIGAGLDFASGTLTATGGGGGGGSGDVTGPATATADSLVLFSGTTGKVIKGGPALGVGSAGSVPTRADADGRYQSKLGFTPANAADTYTKGEVDALVASGGEWSGAATNLSQVPTAALASAISAVKANTSDATFLFIGDSITYGAYSGSDTAPTPNAYENSFVARLSRKVADVLPPSTHVRSGDGDTGAAMINAADPSINIGDWGIAPGATIGGKYFMAPTNGATMTVTSDDPWDQFELIYIRAGAAEALQVGSITLTGPSSETASVDAKAGSGTSSARLVLNRASPAPGAVTLTASLDAGETFYVIGWVFRNTKSRAVHFVNAGIRGANTGTSNATPLGLTRRVANDYVMLAAINGVWKPALTFIMAGVNDARLGGLNPGIATFKSNVQLLINEARLTGSVVLLVPPAFAPSQEGPVPFADYRAAIYDLAAANNLALVDMQKVLGTYAESVANGTQHDDLHPNAAGHELMAQALVQVIRATEGPAIPAVPYFASVAEVRAGTADGKIISPKIMADALAFVPTSRASAASGLDFATFINTSILLDANLTVGGWINKYPGATGIIRFKQDATGGRTVAWASGYIVPAGFSLQATANGVTDVPYLCEADNKIRLYNPSKWSA